MTPTANQPRRRPRAFTLVEILIVVVILGILAAIVIPQFTSAAAQTRENSIQMDLNRIRTQIQIFTQYHNGIGPSLANFTNQMTLATDVNGNTAAVGTPGYQFGPYLLNVPTNPNSGLSTVGSGAVGSSGWYYNESTGDFHANDSAATYAY